MADISKVNVNSTDYDLKDQKSRDALVDVVDDGAKNLLQFDSLPSGTTTYTTAGVKFDILSDGSVKAERVSTSTSVANAVLKIGGNNVYIDNFCNGKFILSGCPSGGGSSTYELMASITGGAYTKRDYGSGVLLTDKGSYSDIYVQCTVRSTFDGEVTFKPMICTKAEWDISQAYVPYGKTNAELTNDTSTLFTENTRQETEIGVVANAGAKNLLKVSVPDAKANAGNTGFTWSGNTASKNHVSFEIKDDLTVYVKSDTGYTASDVTIFYLTDGSCAYPNTILNGCPSGGSATTYELRTATPVKSDYGSGVKITSDSETNVVIIIRSGWSGELTFRPMIRPAAITDTSYQPYARSNPALTAEMDYVVNAGAKNDFDIENLIKSAISENVTYSLSGYSLTASSSGRYARVSIPYKFKAGTTVFSAIVSEYSISGGTMCIRFSTQSSSYGEIASEIKITNNGQYRREITVNADTDGFVVYYINGSPNAYVNSAVFTNNMIRPASITDSTFQPYARTNRELTVLTDEDRAALVEIVDGGAKNVAQTNDITQTGNGFFNTDPISGGLFVSAATVSTTASSSTFAIVFYYTDRTISPTQQLPITNSLVHEFNTGEKVVERVRIFAGDTTESSSGKTITLTNFMICTKAAWQISKTYQPYRPSWQEMYDQVSTLDGITAKIVYTNALLVSTGTSIGSTGLEYTIKGTSTDTYRLTAVGSYNASQPDELRLVNKVTGSLYGIATRSDVGTSASIIVSGCVATGSNITVEVQAKYVSAGNNYIRLIVEKIPMN